MQRRAMRNCVPKSDRERGGESEWREAIVRTGIRYRRHKDMVANTAHGCTF